MPVMSNRCCSRVALGRAGNGAVVNPVCCLCECALSVGAVFCYEQCLCQRTYPLRLLSPYYIVWHICKHVLVVVLPSVLSRHRGHVVQVRHRIVVV